MAEYPDSLIARKCGMSIARQAQGLASRTLQAGRPGDERYLSALSELDFWLRSDGHRRNPGTSADLIAAGLFVGFREQTLSPPWN
jgi:triphosphoribosyl-dephospho-CoA synthase